MIKFAFLYQAQQEADRLLQETLRAEGWGAATTSSANKKRKCIFIISHDSGNEAEPSDKFCCGSGAGTYNIVNIN
jgi:hypothetical protein